MGLLLSVLVACVGVVELLTFFNNIRRNVRRPAQQTDLATIRNGYLKDLYDLRDRVYNDLQDLMNEQQTEDANKKSMVRLTSHEDIELEYNDRIVSRSRTDSPRRFLLTETVNRSRSPTPRHFVVNEEPQQFKSTNRANLPEFLIEEKKLNENQTKRFVLKESNGDDARFPLPEQFVVTEKNRNGKKSRSGSPEPKEFVRPASPYPTFELTAPRNSICSELVDSKVVSVLEVDEDVKSKSPTPEPVHLESTTFNSTEYWTNKILVVPSPKKSKSRSISPKDKSPQNGAATNVNDNDKYDECFLNELDGVTMLQRNNDSRRSIKRKKSKNEAKKLDVASTSHDNNDNLVNIEHTLTEAANELRKLSVENVDVKRDDGENKAFWLIFSGEYTKAMNKDWHGQHFCCWQCDESLTGQRYVLRDEHPYCVSCYESVFANACEKCSRIIGIDSKDLSYKDKHWHEACFLCTTCGESLVDKQFGSKGDRIYCGRCYDEQFASRCDGCHEIFRAGTKKMEYKTRQWHEKCFCCCVCKVPIGTQSFIPREQEIYCAKCYEEKFATRCIKCNKVITSGGVTYKNEPWHRECFTCTHCQKSLAGERFTSRDDKPYCADCFGELFARRCFACNRPITGIGGTKFISFEDRHWHNDCFYCASCRTSLVGRGFITDEDNIICPECAKQKLM